MNKKIVGWLVRHNENQENISFELKEGRNIIGRPTSFFSPEVSIDDEYVSRRHAVINVILNQFNVYEYYIADNEEVNDGKASKNGTYVNGKAERISDPIRLIDGDTIQIGKTKLVLKTADITVDVKDAIRLVKRQEYITSIDFDKDDKTKGRP